MWPPLFFRADSTVGPWRVFIIHKCPLKYTAPLYTVAKMLIKKIRGGFKLPVPPSFLHSSSPSLLTAPVSRRPFGVGAQRALQQTESPKEKKESSKGSSEQQTWTLCTRSWGHSVPDFPGGHGSVASLFLSNRTTTPLASWAKTPGCSAADLTPLTSLLRCACHPWRDSGRELPGGDQSHVPDCPRGPSRSFVLQIAPDWEFRQFFLISVLLLPSFQPASERQGSPSLCWVCLVNNTVASVGVIPTLRWVWMIRSKFTKQHNQEHSLLLAAFYACFLFVWGFFLVFYTRV